MVVIAYLVLFIYNISVIQCPFAISVGAAGIRLGSSTLEPVVFSFLIAPDGKEAWSAFLHSLIRRLASLYLVMYISKDSKKILGNGAAVK